MTPAGYCGRFAPSPTGPLHAGSLVAALGSWLDARAQGGRWLVRIEDVDAPRSIAGVDTFILHQLAALGLHPDETPVYQSQRSATYDAALAKLRTAGWLYPCQCSRKQIVDELTRLGRPPGRGAELVYPGACRQRTLAALRAAWRIRTDLVCTEPVRWYDRRLGWQTQQVEQSVGDFPLRRADGCHTYQLAVVVDDAAQGVTHIVRGEDLADNTARQILLQQALGLPQPRYLHLPLVYGTNGEKLSKQNGAAPLDLANPIAALHRAASVLGLKTPEPLNTALPDALNAWVAAWRELYNPARV